MKSSFLTHSAWSFAALGTFALGYVLAKPANSESGPGSNHSLIVSKGTPGLVPGGPLSVNATEATSAAAAIVARANPLTPTQIDVLARDAFTDPNPLTRSRAFAKLLESMTPENAGALMESLKSNRAGGEQMQLFLYAWGAMDSAGALAHAETLEGRDKARFIQSTLPGWASKNPEAAIAWLDTMAEGEEKERFRGSLVGGLADRDIGLATSYALARGAAGDKEADEYIETITGEQLRRNGPAASVLWGESLPEGPLKDEALEDIADAYVQRDPAAAAAWAEKYATAATGGGIIEEVGGEWAQRDPKAAVTWLNSLADGPAKSEGTFSALREWTRHDPTAASEYLAALPSSTSKDSAVSGFARSLAREDPESAIIWAKTISDEASRVQTLTQAGQAWFRRDPTAAATWLQNSQLPPAAQQAILNPPRDDRRRG